MTRQYLNLLSRPSGLSLALFVFCSVLVAVLFDSSPVVAQIDAALPVHLRVFPCSVNGLNRFEAIHPSMGSLLKVQAYDHDRIRLESVLREAFAFVDDLESRISHYRVDSEVSQLTPGAFKKPLQVSPDLVGLLDRSRGFHQLTGGAFDVTVGPLVKLWGFFDGSPRWPSEAERMECLQTIGMHHLILDKDHSTVQLDRPDIEIDLSAIAKGYAVDRVVEILRERDAGPALVSFGESTHYALEAPPGQSGWYIHFRVPGSEELYHRRVLLRNAALSTSSNEEQHWVRAGNVYGHVLDPRTGFPSSYLGAVSVVAPTAEESDALSTAFLVLGYEVTSRIVPDDQRWKVLFLEPGRAGRDLGFW